MITAIKSKETIKIMHFPAVANLSKSQLANIIAETIIEMLVISTKVYPYLTLNI